MNAPSKLPPQGRIKPKLTKPTARELRFRDDVKAEPCYGCGRSELNEAHHTKLHFPEKRRLKDHGWLLPACPDCHRGRYGIHGIGSEVKWLHGLGRTKDDAINYMASLRVKHGMAT